MKSKLLLPVCSVVISVVVVVGVSVWQPHFVVGSGPDLACELVLMPGKLFASMFRDRGTASPEFLWRTRMATAVLLAGVCYLILRKKTASA